MEKDSRKSVEDFCCRKNLLMISWSVPPPKIILGRIHGIFRREDQLFRCPAIIVKSIESRLFFQVTGYCRIRCWSKPDRKSWLRDLSGLANGYAWRKAFRNRYELMVRSGRNLIYFCSSLEISNYYVFVGPGSSPACLGRTPKKLLAYKRPG